MEIIIAAEDVRAMSKLIVPKSKQPELSIFAHNGDMIIIAGDNHAMGILKCHGDIHSEEEWAFTIPYHIAKSLPSKGVIEVVVRDGWHLPILINAGDASYTASNTDQARTRLKCLKVLELIPHQLTHVPGLCIDPNLIQRFLALQSVYVGRNGMPIRAHPGETVGVVVIPGMEERFIGVFAPLRFDKTDFIDTFLRYIKWNS